MDNIYCSIWLMYKEVIGRCSSEDYSTGKLLKLTFWENQIMYDSPPVMLYKVRVCEE